MMVDPMFMIVQHFRWFLTAVTPTDDAPTVVILPEFTRIYLNLPDLPKFTTIYLNFPEFT